MFFCIITQNNLKSIVDRHSFYNPSHKGEVLVSTKLLTEENLMVIANIGYWFGFMLHKNNLVYVLNVQVSKSDHGSVRDLVWDLIFSKNITNEIEKCR